MSDPPSDTAANRDGGPILIDLALQGGGAHGAFTWGVLDVNFREVVHSVRTGNADVAKP